MERLTFVASFIAIYALTPLPRDIVSLFPQVGNAHESSSWNRQNKGRRHQLVYE